MNTQKMFARGGAGVAMLCLVGCCSIERTGEYYVATKTMTFQKLDEYHRKIGDSTYMPLPFSIGIPDKDMEGATYLPPSAGVMLFFAGFLPEDPWPTPLSRLPPMTALFCAPAGAVVWAGEALVLAPVWDTFCLPVDFYRRDEYLKETSDKVETEEAK